MKNNFILRFLDSGIGQHGRIVVEKDDTDIEPGTHLWLCRIPLDGLLGLGGQ